MSQKFGNKRQFTGDSERSLVIILAKLKVVDVSVCVCVCVCVCVHLVAYLKQK